MGNNPSEFKGADLPVEKVSWYDAIEYCNKRSLKEGLTPAYIIDKILKDENNKNDYDKARWLVTWNTNADGYRLPTEAEWEYACRAGTTTPFSTGNTIGLGQANYHLITTYASSFEGKAMAVGSFAPNPWGLYDMHGNVSEWCYDWYGAYSKEAQIDPVGTSSGSYRVVRGGSYLVSSNQGLRSAYRRGRGDPDLPIRTGIRLVRN
jgi:formylglycine-generating enzyme required for sulfatase activity